MDFFSALFSKTDNSQLSEIIKDGAYLVDVRAPGGGSASKNGRIRWQQSGISPTNELERLINENI